MTFIKQFINKAINSIFFNHKRPLYFAYLYDLSKRYVHFFQGDENADMETNGEYRFLRKLFTIKKLKTVFDVGSNEGEYSEIITKNDHHTKIFCFDPDRDALETLQNKIGRSDNLNIVNGAVGDFDGESEFIFNNVSNKINSFYDMKEIGYSEGSQKRKVTVLKLDTYCKQNTINHIDLLKVDVEGHEEKVFVGATELLSANKVDIIQFEYGYAAIYGNTFFRNLYNLFDKFGYDIYKIKPKSIIKIKYSPELEHCSYGNFLAIRKNLNYLKYLL